MTWKIIQFWKDNLNQHFKRISIALGTFFFCCVICIGLPAPERIIYLYGSLTTLSGIVIMSIFGQNGNNNSNGNDIKHFPKKEVKKENVP